MSSSLSEVNHLWRICKSSSSKNCLVSYSLQMKEHINTYILWRRDIHQLEWCLLKIVSPLTITAWLDIFMILRCSKQPVVDLETSLWRFSKTRHCGPSAKSVCICVCARAQNGILLLSILVEKFKVLTSLAISHEKKKPGHLLLLLLLILLIQISLCGSDSQRYGQQN